MKIAIVLNLMVSLLWSAIINAQIEDQSIPLSAQNKSVEIPFEKVYLHLDRPYYSAGDDIWIKAYLVDAMTNKLSDNSNTLNIELISPDSKILKRLILRMDNGLGFGDIHLGDSIASGNYKVRAYTNWMQNYDEVFFFKKEIVIENQIGIMASDQSKPEGGDKKVDVQFFPEGGPLIENVYTLLGFKAVNSSGYGCNIKGQVLSSPGDTVASFAGTHLGMGSVFFLPKKGLKYFATGSAGNGVPFKVELPTALETGYSLKVSDINKEYFRVTIKTNNETLDRYPIHQLIIVGTSHNSLCLTASVKVRAIDNPVILPKKEFPEGVALITLMDTTGRKYCERLYYVHKTENYRISIIPDNEVYAPRQKVTLQISVKDTSDKPVYANLSVSVVDGTQLKGFDKNPDISSYLLLESEIRGFIEQPFYYFNSTVPDRFQALDNLLLTQGWRNLIWNYLPDTADKFNYQIEKGITLSGRLRHIWTDKQIVDARISMAMVGNNVKPFYRFTQTDSAGKYYFDGLNFTGRQNIIVKAANKKDKSKGWISIDSLFRDPAPVNFKQTYKSETTVKNSSDIIEVSSSIQASNINQISDYKEEARRKYYILKKYKITDTIPLKEVVVNARRPVDENADGHIRLYGVPDYSLKVTSNMLNYPNIFQSILGRIGGFYIGGDYINGYVFIMRGQKGSPLFLIDGKEVEYQTILSLPMAAVDKIEVIKDGGKLALFGFRGSNGVISVLTKSEIDRPATPVLSFINQRVSGYYQARTFYVPKYNVPQPEYNKPDLRTTIHWEPNIVTDKDGNATVSFFSTDNKTIIVVDAEGIAEPGMPLSGKISFYVK